MDVEAKSKKQEIRSNDNFFIFRSYRRSGGRDFDNQEEQDRICQERIQAKEWG
jgi:hypothetical protein